MLDYDYYDNAYDENFSEMSVLEKGLRYLKLRTLIDIKTLKPSKKLLDFFGVKKSYVNGKLVNELRRDAFSNDKFTDENIDTLLKDAYSDVKKDRDINEDEIKRSIIKIAKEGDEYWESWNGVFADDIRRHVQRHFVRNPSIKSIEQLLSEMDEKLNSTVRGYTVISWYNQWSSHIIEDYLMSHPKVIPTLRRIDKVDFFVKDIPFDLKITFVPRQYIKDSIKDGLISEKGEIIEYIENNIDRLIIWLYERQGEQRFSANHRLFIVSANQNNLDDSWKLKSDFTSIQNHLNEFLHEYDNKEDLSKVKWNYKNKEYTTYSKLILVKEN